MDGLELFKDFLAAGGDIGVYVVAWILWKFDRRLLKLETTVAERAAAVSEATKNG